MEAQRDVADEPVVGRRLRALRIVVLPDVEEETDDRDLDVVELVAEGKRGEREVVKEKGMR